MERVVQGTLHYTELTNLLKFSRYRIKVLAFTGGGDGVASQPVVVRTAEDSKLNVYTSNCLSLH